MIMKKRKIVLIALLLVSAFLLSSCLVTIDVEEQEPTVKQKYLKTIPEFSENYVGSWHAVAATGDCFTIEPEGIGTLSVTLATGETESHLIYIAAVQPDPEVITVNDGLTGETLMYLQYADGFFYYAGGMEISLDIEQFYKEGSSNPADAFFGTWTRCSGTDYDYLEWNGSIVSEFTITRDGLVQINGDEFSFTFYCEFGKFFISTDDSKIMVSPAEDNQNGAMDLFINGTSWGDAYYKDAKSVELTQENWQDYFETRISYSISKNVWGDLEYAVARVFLVPKDEIVCLGITSGRVSMLSSPSAYAMLHYDLDTDEYEIVEMTSKESSKYNDRYYRSLKDYRNETEFMCLWNWPETCTETFDGIGAVVVSYWEDNFTLDGNTVVAPTVTDCVVTVERIMGTLYYR